MNHISYQARTKFLDGLQFCCGTVSGWILHAGVFLCFGKKAWQSTNTTLHTKWIAGREPSFYSKKEFRIINQHLKDRLTPGEALYKLRKWKD